ncbi:MAG TPA: glycosyltransferase family 2 protein [Candidatus Saccharimonadales bacterium]
MQKQPTVSIVIPAYNEEESIERCLMSCAEQSDMADEIIVIDNNSTDETVEIVKAFAKAHPAARISLFKEKKQGIIPARNTGIRKASCDVVGRIDADTRLEDGWVTAIRETFSDESVSAASGPVLYHDMPLKKFGFKADDRIRKTLIKNAKDHRFLFGSNMAVRKTAWDQVFRHLALDEADELHEDVDIALTFFENDLEIVYAPGMIAGMSSRRLEDSPRDFYNYVMRFERTYKAHGVKSARARVPIFIYLMIYFPVRTIRKFYDGETSKFTLEKLREDLKIIGGREK